MPPLLNTPALFSRRWWLTIALGLLALILAHWMAIAYRIQPAVSLWFPPSGIAIALTLWLGPVGVILTGLASILMAPLWDNDGWTRIIALTDATEPLVAWFLYRHCWKGSLVPKRLRDAAAFTLSAPFAACATSAIIGSLALAAIGKMPVAKLATSIPHWWLGNAIGTMAIAPTALLLFQFLKAIRAQRRSPLSIWQRWDELSPEGRKGGEKGEVRREKGSRGAGEQGSRGAGEQGSRGEKKNQSSLSYNLQSSALHPHFRRLVGESIAIAIFTLCTALLTVSKTNNFGFEFQQLSFLSFVPILWAAIRFGVTGGAIASTFCVMVTMLAYLVVYPNAISLPRFPVQAEVLHVHQLSLLVQCTVSLFVGCAIAERSESQVALAVERVRVAEFEARAQLSEQLIQLNASLEESNRYKDELLRREQIARAETDSARKQVAQILESITDGFIALDGSWRFTYINQEAARTLGHSQEELLGKNLWEELPELEDTNFGQFYRRAVAEQVPVEIEDYYPPFDAWFTVRAYPSESGLSLYFRNISDRKRTELHLAVQYAVTRVLAEASALSDVVPSILQSLSESLGWQMGIIWLADRRDNVLRCVNSWHAASVNVEEFEEANRQIAFAPGMGLPGRIWAIGQPVWIADVIEDEKFFRAAIAAKCGLHAVCGFPILLGNEILGVIECFSDKIQQPDEDLLEMVATIGTQLGQFIEHKRAEAALRENEQRFRVALQGSSIIVFSQDRHLRHTWIYNAHPDFSAESILGKTDMEILPQETAKRITALKQGVIDNGVRTRTEIDMTISGQIMTYDLALEPLRDATGAIVGLTGAAADITERKRTELALQESEERFRQLAENIGAVFFMSEGFSETSAGRILYVSQGYEKILGRSRDRLYQNPRSWFEAVHPDDRDRVRAALPNMARAELDVQYRMVRPDGEIRWVHARAFPVYNDRGEVYRSAGIVEDITDRKLAEEARREAEERLRVAIQNSPITVFNQDRDLRYTWVYNPALNRSVDELIGKSDEEFLVPEDAEVLTLIKRRVLETGVGTRQEVKLAMHGRDWYYDLAVEPLRDESGEVVGITCAAVDVSDRKQAEEALRYLAETSSILATSLDYQATLERVAQIPIPQLADWCSVDIFSEDGSIRRLPVAHADPSKAEWARHLQQYPPDLDGSNAIAKVLQTGQSVLFLELPDSLVLASTRNAEHLHVIREMGIKSAMIVPIVARERILGSITFIRAESGRRYSAADLSVAEEFARLGALAIDNARAHREAQEANRIKDEFLAVLSHELRSPLNPILGWVRLLRTRKFDVKTTDRALETIERNAKLQTQLVEDLLDVSRILRGKLSLKVCSVNLTLIIEAAIETVRLAAEAKSIQIRTAVESNLGQVNGDPGRLQQVVWNLLSNAIKFTPEGGSVEVRLSTEIGNRQKEMGNRNEEKLPITHYPLPITQYVFLQVSDTGIGIEADFLPYVFEHFRQADSSITRKHGGLGLGLAIVRYLVELHGGTVWAESAGVGQGTTVTVSLPLGERGLLMGDDGWGNSQFSIPNSQFSMLSGLRILIVDDEADTREFLSFVLKQYGAQTMVVESAPFAIAQLGKFKPDVLVSDIGMPEEDGYSLIRKVRSRLKEEGGAIPAVALTAYAREEDAREALLAGFQIHLSKPIEPEELLGAIASLVKTSAFPLPSF